MKRELSRRGFIVGSCAAGAAAMLGTTGCAPRSAQPAVLWKPRTGERFALANAHIVDVEKGELISGKVLLVMGDKIEDIVLPEDPRTANAREINCMGSYLIPGLINAHTHITQPSVAHFEMSEVGEVMDQVIHNYEDSLTWGVTTVRDMGSMPKIMDRDKSRIDAGKLHGPHILTPIGFISVPGGYPEFMQELPFLTRLMIGRPTLVVENAAEARDAVKRYHDLGADFVKIALDHKSLIYGHDDLPVFTDDQLEAIRDETVKLGMKVAAHHTYSQGLRQGIKFAVDSLEHLPGDREITDEEAMMVTDSLTPFVPTATAGINLAYTSEGDPYSSDPFVVHALQWREENVLPELPKHCLPKVQELCLESMEYYEREDYRDPEKAFFPTFNPPVFTRMVAKGSVNLEKLISAGAVIGMGNDSGLPLLFPGALHHEMEIVAERGMTAAQALRAATMVNARICGLEDVCGKLVPGMRADITMLQKNPLEDVHNAATIQCTIKSGAFVHYTTERFPPV